MKFELPNEHGLSESAIKDLLFREGEKPALTDCQHEALRLGVARGESLLVASPTSTGKTHIAMWAIATGISTRRNTVYLVTLRALARQKFEEFKRRLLTPFLSGNASSLVIATGDYVLDAAGDVPADPLHAPILVATYEKYLALLSASGVPSDYRTTVVVCDEIQLIGDPSRGQSVEVLLTLLRNAGWAQIVGLSAVLSEKDARDLATWLGVQLILTSTREKHLRYECWSANGIASVSTERPDSINENGPLPPKVPIDPISIVRSLLASNPAPTAIIVFCTRKKQDTYDLADRFMASMGVRQQQSNQLSLAFDGLPPTSANTFLARTLAARIAVHSADLTDEEREVVENHLSEGKLDVVFATTTLAAGVNFPLGAAVFASWDRWDRDLRAYSPIDPAEFHNMAGRVGRMGFSHDQGRVIFLAETAAAAKNARQFLELATKATLPPRITPVIFDQLALQMVASSLCDSCEQLEKLVCSTFSGQREEQLNFVGFQQWPAKLSLAIDWLVENRLLMRTSTGRLTATRFGKAVASSGFLPRTGIFLAEQLCAKVHRLTSRLPSASSEGDLPKLVFSLFSICFSSPEFRPMGGSQPSRPLPWPLSSGLLADPPVERDDLGERVWEADFVPINASILAAAWIAGTDLRELESRLGSLSAGMLRDMFRNLSWMLQGIGAIIAAITEVGVPSEAQPKATAISGASTNTLRKLIRIARALGRQVAEGVPSDVLWLCDVVKPGSAFHIFRHEIMDLAKAKYASPAKLMLGTPEADTVRVTVFAKAKPSPQAKANWLRDAVRTWKTDQRRRAAESHLKRARRCPNRPLIERFYQSRGTDFERSFEECLTHLGIVHVRLDDPTKTGAPDYLLTFEGSPPLVVELKSKEGDALVDYNRAVEVLSASEVHGHGETFCVTVCHPGVDPSVPLVIVGCARLSVVEANDFGEALLRICEGVLTQEQLWQWLATPGQALSSDLPFREFVAAGGS